MKLITYLTYQRLILAVHYLFYPLLVVIGPFIGFIRKRRQFELEGRTPSFKESNNQATHCFHVSSEGELEQALPLIEFYLNKGQLIELVYTSDSVTRKCDALSHKYTNLNILRMPLVSFPKVSFRRWVTAKKFFMCRYDFFSELMLYGAREDITFTLLSASLKGKSVNGFKKYFLRSLYSCFDSIIAASDVEKDNFLRLDPSFNVSSFEFRLLQISSRLSESENKFSERKELTIFIDTLKERNPLSSLIIGSAWPIEMQIFKDKTLVSKILNGELLVTIAPHSLREESIKDIQLKLKEIAPSLKVVNVKDMTGYKSGEVYLNTVPGVLLETYSFFGHVFVAGGHGRSIHSVLEPYLAGSRVYCGPKIHRSTEFDFIKKESPNDVVVIDRLEELSSSLVVYNRELEIEKRRSLVLSYRARFNEMMERF